MAVTCPSWPFRRQQVQFLRILWVAMVRVLGAEALTGRVPVGESLWVLSCAANEWCLCWIWLNPCAICWGFLILLPAWASLRGSELNNEHGPRKCHRKGWFEGNDAYQHSNTDCQRPCHFRWVPIFLVLSPNFLTELVPSASSRGRSERLWSLCPRRSLDVQQDIWTVASAAARPQALVRRVAATQFQHAFQHLQHLQQMIEPMDFFLNHVLSCFYRALSCFFLYSLFFFYFWIMISCLIMF